MRRISTEIRDKNKNTIYVDDIVIAPGTEGPIKFKVVLLEEDGYNGFYAQEISDLGGMTRTQRVLLSAMSDIEVVS